MDTGTPEITELQRASHSSEPSSPKVVTGRAEGKGGAQAGISSGCSGPAAPWHPGPHSACIPEPSLGPAGGPGREAGVASPLPPSPLQSAPARARLSQLP